MYYIIGDGKIRLILITLKLHEYGYFKINPNGIKECISVE